VAGLDIQAIQDAKDALNEDKVPHSEFMRVSMNGVVFALTVESVLSVVRPAVITPVPMAPDHLIGVTNVRGQIFCIIDPGKVLRLPQEIQEKTTLTRFVLLRHDRMHLGIWADAVADLYSIPTSDVPKDSGDKQTMGVLNVGNEALQILRVSALLD
jgi:chemotaxis signal transduction protein